MPGAPEKQVSNNGLAKLFTVEIIVPTLLFAVAWGVVTNQVLEAKEDIKSLQKKDESVSRDLSSIQSNTGKIKTNQENIEDDIEEIKAILKEMNDRELERARSTRRNSGGS